MESTKTVVSEEKKLWTSPELKRLDVDDVTANGGSKGSDGSLTGS
jgi:hypothetical protein